MSQTIALNRGFVSIVDDEDYERLARIKWSMRPDPPKFYAVTWSRRAGAPTLMHRIILDATPLQIVDHRNGDGLDNRRLNLRTCTVAQNSANSPKRKSDSSSRFKGVCWNSKSTKWQAGIKCHGRSTHLGLFELEEAAAAAYDNAARQLHGAFAVVNFPRAGERGALGPAHTGERGHVFM